MRDELTRDRLRALVDEIPGPAYAKYPSLSRSAVAQAVEKFLAAME